MTQVIPIEPKTTALLIMDFQKCVVENCAPDKEALLVRTAELLAAARATDITVIHVIVGFRLGYPELNAQNMLFSPIKEAGRLTPGDAGAEIHPAVAPKVGEPIVTKCRVSAFHGTELDMILRANGAKTLVLAGVVTSGVVLSTLCQAIDADYRLIVVRDCCSDENEEIHRALIENFFPRRATVISAQEVIDALH